MESREKSEEMLLCSSDSNWDAEQVSDATFDLAGAEMERRAVYTIAEFVCLGQVLAVGSCRPTTYIAHAFCAYVSRSGPRYGSSLRRTTCCLHFFCHHMTQSGPRCGLPPLLPQCAQFWRAQLLNLKHPVSCIFLLSPHRTRSKRIEYEYTSSTLLKHFKSLLPIHSPYTTGTLPEPPNCRTTCSPTCSLTCKLPTGLSNKNTTNSLRLGHLRCHMASNVPTHLRITNTVNLAFKLPSYTHSYPG